MRWANADLTGCRIYGNLSYATGLPLISVTGLGGGGASTRT